MKKLFKAILLVFLIIIVLLAGLLVFLTVTEYRPEAVEAATVLSKDDAAGALQAARYRQMPAVTKRRQILPIRKETGCFDMALLCDFCYDNINT